MYHFRKPRERDRWEPFFWEKVNKDAPNGCWEWTAHRQALGYGHFNSRDPEFKTRFPHRIAWMLLRGPIPEGMFIDHLCRNPGCLNPDHLEVVTPRENQQRSVAATKTHCVKGHPYTQETTYSKPLDQRNGRRECKVCKREWHRRSIEKYQASLRVAPATSEDA